MERAPIRFEKRIRSIRSLPQGQFDKYRQMFDSKTQKENSERAILTEKKQRSSSIEESQSEESNSKSSSIYFDTKQIEKIIIETAWRESDADHVNHEESNQINSNEYNNKDNHNHNSNIGQILNSQCLNSSSDLFASNGKNYSNNHSNSDQNTTTTNNNNHNSSSISSLNSSSSLCSVSSINRPLSKLVSENFSELDKEKSYSDEKQSPNIVNKQKILLLPYTDDEKNKHLELNKLKINREMNEIFKDVSEETNSLLRSLCLSNKQINDFLLTNALINSKNTEKDAAENRTAENENDRVIQKTNSLQITELNDSNTERISSNCSSNSKFSSIDKKPFINIYSATTGSKIARSNFTKAEPHSRYMKLSSSSTSPSSTMSSYSINLIPNTNSELKISSKSESKINEISRRPQYSNSSNLFKKSTQGADLSIYEKNSLSNELIDEATNTFTTIFSGQTNDDLIHNKKDEPLNNYYSEENYSELDDFDFSDEDDNEDNHDDNQTSELGCSNDLITTYSNGKDQPNNNLVAFNENAAGDYIDSFLENFSIISKNSEINQLSIAQKLEQVPPPKPKRTFEHDIYTESKKTCQSNNNSNQDEINYDMNQKSLIHKQTDHLYEKLHNCSEEKVRTNNYAYLCEMVDGTKTENQTSQIVIVFLLLFQISLIKIKLLSNAVIVSFF
jgi:hypothetical protein